MPRPPILPTIDWKNIFDTALDFNAWLAAEGREDRDEKMRQLIDDFHMRTHEEGMLRALARPVYVIAIAENWCGDVIRHVPVLQKMADIAPNIHIRYIKREQNKEIFARFLTNGGEAIPKFIFLSSEWVECGNWGPMPSRCRELVARGRACGDIAAARKKVAAHYEADPECREVFAELLQLIDIASTMSV